MGVDPARRGEIEEDAPVETAWRPEVDVLDRRRDAQLGRPEVALQSAVLAVGRLPVDEQAETVLEAEAAIGGRLLTLLGEGVGHAREVEGVELVERRVGLSMGSPSSLVVGGAADVGVSRREPNAVPAPAAAAGRDRAQDRLDAPIVEGADREGPGAGGLETLGAIAAAETHDARGSSDSPARDGAGEPGSSATRRAGRRSGLLAPGDQARGRPLEMAAVGLGHVRGVGRGPVRLVAARMARHPPAPDEDLDRASPMRTSAVSPTSW